MRAWVFGVMLSVATLAHSESGKLKVCRNPPIVDLSSGKVVKFPPLSYVGACDKSGDNCRPITVEAEGGTIGKDANACTVLAATVKQADGNPIKSGTVLRPSYSSTDDFKNKGYEHFSEVFIGSARITAFGDFK